MTWEELIEKAKELGYKGVKKAPYGITEIALVNDNGYAFYQDGAVEQDCDNETIYCGQTFATDRTPEQMLMIMEALK